MKGKTVAVALCGGNIDTSTPGYIERVDADGRLINEGRDRPGVFRYAVIAEAGASIKHINHDRARLGEESHSVLVTVEASVHRPDMAKDLIQLDKNYKIRQCKHVVKQEIIKGDGRKSTSINVLLT